MIWTIFRRNWVKRKPEWRGCLFFSQQKAAKRKAENFINNVVLEKGDLPPVLDIERTYGTSAEQIRQQAKDWLVMIEKRGIKINHHLYAMLFLRKFLAGQFDDYLMGGAIPGEKTNHALNATGFSGNNETGM